jgi:hypothetical protein
LIGTIFVQLDDDAAVAQLSAVVDELEPTAHGVVSRIADVEADLLAHTGFPVSLWSKIWLNDSIERA